MIRIALLGISLLSCSVAAASGGVNSFNSTTIYSSGDVVLMFPVETTTISLVVFLAAAIFEFIIDTVGGAQNKYFRVMFNAIVQQVMIVGVLILALLFTQTVYNWPPIWVFMFKWSMMCLFAMITIFILQIVFLLWLATRSATTWEQFESTKMDAEGADLSGWEAQYKLSSYKFFDALKAYGYNSSNGVRFSQYLSKVIRRNVFSMTSVNWVSWICLATVVVVNGLRAEASMKLSLINTEDVSGQLNDWQRFVNYFSFVLLVGYVAMGIFLALFVTLIRRLDNFLEGTRSSAVQAAAVATSRRALYGANASAPLAGGETTVTIDSLDDPRSYLFRRSLDATLELVQATMLITQWYFATFVLGFVYQLIFLVSLPYSVPVLVLGVVPIVVPMIFTPRLLLVVTILGSLGTNLDEYAVQYLIKAAKIPEAEWPEKMRKRLAAFAKKKAKRKARIEESNDAAPSPVNAE